MDELVAKVAQSTGVEASTARKAVVIILQFLLNAGPKDKVEKLIEDLPGARAAIGGNGSGGGGPSDIMGAFAALTGAGLGMSQIQGVARAFGKVAREHVGSQTIDEVVAGIPGLSQFV
jgi:hypothetical protein